MRRLLRVLLVIVVFSPMATDASPASGLVPDTPTCAGQYRFTLDTAMPLPSNPPAAGVGFTMSRTSGACTGNPATGHPAPETFWGWLDGNCGAATGEGLLPDGHWFDITWDGTSLSMEGFFINTTFPDVQVSGTGAFAITSVLDCSGTTFDTVGAITSVPYARACAGVGTLTLSPPFSTTSIRTAGFSFGAAVGLCSNLSTFSGSGVVTGNCEFATGTGTANGSSFTIVWTANRLTFSGNFIGVGNVAPATGTGDCVTGAQHFLMNGAGVQLA